MDEQDWYDKDLSDFDEPQDEIILPKTKQISIIQSSNSNGNIYPYDFWYLISMYIPPEDVGRFSLICRTTNQIVNSISFWISLFRKYNQMEAKRIIRILKKEHVSIIRMYTIKSLYKNYSLFQKRMNKTIAIQKEPHFLQSSRCIRIWYSKFPSQIDYYNYYFQFSFDDTQEEKQSIEPLSSIFNNQYKISQNTCILHVISSNFIPIGPYMGMILSKLTLNMSSDYRYYKLKMWFDSTKFSRQSSSSNIPVIIIDPVLCLRIYKWYNIPDNFD